MDPVISRDTFDGLEAFSASDLEDDLEKWLDAICVSTNNFAVAEMNFERLPLWASYYRRQVFSWDTPTPHYVPPDTLEAYYARNKTVLKQFFAIGLPIILGAPNICPMLGIANGVRAILVSLELSTRHTPEEVEEITTSSDPSIHLKYPPRTIIVQVSGIRHCDLYSQLEDDTVIAWGKDEDGTYWVHVPLKMHLEKDTQSKKLWTESSTRGTHIKPLRQRFPYDLIFGLSEYRIQVPLTLVSFWYEVWFI